MSNNQTISAPRALLEQFLAGGRQCDREQLRALLDAPTRQYYYRINGCMAHGSTDTGCICWHDEGSGPLYGNPMTSVKPISWREKPAAMPQGKDWEGLHAAMLLQRDHWRYRAQKAEGQPLGEPVARIEGLYGDPEAFAEREIRPLCDVNKLKIGTMLYAEQPAPVAVASLEIVGRQCFPSEAMKATPEYRKEPWVDGDVDQVPSEPGFYRVEPLVRLSDVTRLNTK